MSDRSEYMRAVAIVVEAGFKESAVVRAGSVLNAMSELQRAGLRLVLVQPDEVAVVKRTTEEPKRRRWWQKGEAS